jgi:PAS domain S-box-containing protein
VSIVVIAILALAVIGYGIVSNLIVTHNSLESARAVLRFNSESTLSGIKKLMMSRNNAGVMELIDDMSQGSTVYQDVRLVSHHSGEVVASRLESAGDVMGMQSESCLLCHIQDGRPGETTSSQDRVLVRPDGTKVLQVVTPIINEPNCQTADCHVHTDSAPVLGFLQTDYSLENVTGFISGLNVYIGLTALAAILLGIVALRVMLKRLLEKPLGILVDGIQATATDNLVFRFNTDRNDEIGVVQESFDNMASRIQAHQTALRQAMEYLEGIVENSADIIITVNPKGLIQTFNTGAEQALGYDRKEVVGKRIEMLFADPHEREIAVARLRDRDNVTNYETHFLARDGEVKNVLLTLSRLRDREGNTIGTFGISKDITREKELQGQLIQSEKAAAIGRAVTAIQHAIKNMLNALTGGAYLARIGMGKENWVRVGEGCEMIEDGIERIRDLSSRMLKYAKEWELELEETDLMHLLEQVSSVVRQTAREKGIALSSEIAGSPTLAWCDPRLLHMSLLDIVTNALDACIVKDYEQTETPHIVLSVYMTGDDRQIVIEVADNGVGMTDDVRDNIFTPFFSTKAQTGTGLGLALTFRVVQLHRGSIHVESEPDRGTTFRITLPVEGPNSSSVV